MNRLGKILVLNDARLSSQKATNLTRLLNVFRQFAEVRQLDGNLSEDELVAEMETANAQLVLLPWYRYLSWSKAEAFYGLTRNSGPTVAGFHFGGVGVTDFEKKSNLRAILLDFAGPSSMDVARVVRALMVDRTRGGLIPLLGQPSTVYFEDWMDQQGLGHRIDALLGIADIQKTDWNQRLGSLRIAMSALWSLIYEEGPGKSEFAQSITSNQPKACFQIAASTQFLGLRLIYSMPTWSPKDAVEHFWPSVEKPGSAAQLLRTYCDFLRVHRIADTPDVEIVAGFFKSAPAERSPNCIHTYWIEPLAAKLIDEVPYQKPSADFPYLKPFATAIPPRPDETATAAREKILNELAIQIKELKRIIQEKDYRIEELKSGGVSASQPTPTPPADADTLLDAFLEYFYRDRLRNQEIQQKIDQITAGKFYPKKTEDILALEKQLQAMLHQQEEWIRKIADVLRAYAQDRKHLKRVA